jgi:hypothetical protein
MPDSGKYGEVTTERGDWPFADEPVFLIRARDVAALPTIRQYYQECAAKGAQPDHLNGIQQALSRFARWKVEHPDDMHVPDSDPPTSE